MQKIKFAHKMNSVVLPNGELVHFDGLFGVFKATGFIAHYENIERRGDTEKERAKVADMPRAIRDRREAGSATPDGAVDPAAPRSAAVSWNIELDNGDLFSFKSEDEARAFYRGYRYAQRVVTAAVLEIATAPERAGAAPVLPSSVSPATGQKLPILTR